MHANHNNGVGGERRFNIDFPLPLDEALFVTHWQRTQDTAIRNGNNIILATRMDDQNVIELNDSIVERQSIKLSIFVFFL